MGGSGQRLQGRKAGGGATEPKRVLVVDDEVSVRRLLGDLFASEGYLVGEASDGAQALECAHVFRPDVIILDLMMPVMSGWTFAQEYRRIDGHGDVPIIAVSAMFQLHEATPTLNSFGVRACIAKPFDVETLLSLVSTLVDSPRRPVR